jgi:hypothetical protein
VSGHGHAMGGGGEEGPHDETALSACCSEDNDEGVGLRCAGRNDWVRSFGLATNVQRESETVKVPSAED